MTHTRTLLTALAIFLVAGNLVIDRWPDTLYHGDSCFYYMHVVSAFVHGDVGDYDKTITTLREVNPSSADPREDIYGVRLTEKGRRYIKYTLGVPLLETPFFFLGHLYAKASPEYEANGWTRPYAASVGFAIVCYVILAFYLLIKPLKRYFSDRVVTITCIALAAATNLFYHTNYVTMSHGFLFFLHTWLLHATVRFWESPKATRALLLGAVVGLIALTRVPEIVVALVPVVWGVYDGKTLIGRLDFIKQNFLLLAPAVVGFGLVFSLQIAYWYYVSGQLIFNPYEGEGFDFLKPRIWQAFFYFNNGWLIYTPIMFFALGGLFVLGRYAKGWLLPILVFTVLNTWIHYSYYVYSYFPGLGQRPMVDAYPYLAFGLAAGFAGLSGSKRWKWLPVVATVLFAALNIFQTWQSREGYIWTERHNRAFYVASFGKLSNSINALRAYHTNSLQPDEGKLVLIDTLASDDFEDVARYGPTVSKDHSLSGQFAYHDPQEFQNLSEHLPLPASAAGEYLKVGVQGYLAEGTPYPNRDALLTLVAEIYDENGSKQFTRRIPISAFIGNEDGNIWSLGKQGVWGEAAFYVHLPGSLREGWYAKTFLHNWPQQDVWVDDYRAILYRKE
ncbi:hypothetical protein [Neolewinella antarctica]|uniref:Glycosyltransferase RgtA/B/C/D-like domain-containing protein n=1 Tax=Neolewinella antarctica TaxID=442734 RepID=A0ABX0XDY9_9BACT|nr:hypothetical protein [Neolewinella antarctica]NJC27466.1 hypothetical protein [Neolewinella antarctica]